MTKIVEEPTTLMLTTILLPKTARKKDYRRMYFLTKEARSRGIRENRKEMNCQRKN